MEQLTASVIAVSVLLLAGFSPIAALAYDNTCGGTAMWKWASSSVPVDVTDSSWPVSWSTITANSMSSWNAVTPSNFLLNVGTTGTHNLFYKNLGLTGYQGLTTITKSGNTITDIYTTLNSYYSWSSAPSGPQYDIQGVLTHELGHWACLDHGSVGTETMYYNIPPASTIYRTLEADDIAGLNSLGY